MKEDTKNTFLEKFIISVEKLGNKLPHPFWIFVFLCAIILTLSVILNLLGTSVTYISGKDIKEVTVGVVNLLSFDQMREFLANFTKIYIGFPPLGLVVVMMLGVSMIEQTGFISALMRKTILYAPNYIVTSTLIFVGINANLASDAGLLFVPTLGAAIYKALGRNPWIGIIAGYAAASGGISANLLISGLDVVLAGITESASVNIDTNIVISPIMNWYFLIAATILLTVVLTIVTEKFLVKIVGDNDTISSKDEVVNYTLSDNEKIGLKFSLIGLIAFIIILSILTLPSNSFFRNENGGFLPTSPILKSIMPIIFFLFLFVGVSFAFGAKVITNINDIPKMMQKQLVSVTGILTVMFPASMFIYFFSESNLAEIIAVNGASILEKMNLGGVPLIIMLVLLCGSLNLFMGSSSAKWLILAPIFIPMFSIAGFSPALTQVAYRIGDGATNIISPIASAVPLILGLLEQYKKDGYKGKIGVGTMIALELPFSIAILVSQIILLIIWYIFNIPLGPGA